MKFLVVVDMQRDFIDGALGTPEAQAIVPRVAQVVQDFQGEVVLTLDTHDQEYLNTQEGRQLPVPHCVAGTPGHQMCEELRSLARVRQARVFLKPSFGSVELAWYLCDYHHQQQAIEEIQLVGLCTDICVVSNALLLKAYLPEVPLSVRADCCAGVTPEKHQAALETLRSCQVAVR